VKALVTGAGGFLGSAITRQLLSRGDEVNTFQRRSYPLLEKLGAKQFHGDLTDSNALSKAIAGCDIVFHVAAKVGVWGDYEDFHKVNVSGTENVVNQCRKHNVSKLVYTCSPSVVFDGRNDEGINETAPYSVRYLSHYPKTKAIAEKIVLSANSPKLATVSLRPHLIWGPGDPHLIPKILASAKKGKLRLVGDGRNLVDSTYIDNAAASHLNAADKLHYNSACSGRAYFISNGEPLPIGDLIKKILDAGHISQEVKTIRPKDAYYMGGMMELVYKLLRVKKQPIVTRFIALEMSTAHWFDISAAKTDIDYEPIIAIDEGMRRLEASLLNESRIS
jgi:nucleoside-diphosphate-sugar epimerase